MKETYEQLKAMLACDKFIITGSHALKKYKLLDNAHDLDVILVNPTEETLKLLKRLEEEKPALTKAKATDEKYERNQLRAIFKWGNVKVDVFVSNDEETITIDGFEYAIIPNIIKAKLQAGRAKDIVQLRKIARMFMSNATLSKWFDNQEERLC